MWPVLKPERGLGRLWLRAMEEVWLEPRGEWGQVVCGCGLTGGDGLLLFVSVWWRVGTGGWGGGVSQT
ncbi:hypothetical protein GCM10009736_13450 [Actinomadura bangladeshensis]